MEPADPNFFTAMKPAVKLLFADIADAYLKPTVLHGIVLNGPNYFFSEVGNYYPNLEEIHIIGFNDDEDLSFTGSNLPVSLEKIVVYGDDGSLISKINTLPRPYGCQLIAGDKISYNSLQSPVPIFGRFAPERIDYVPKSGVRTIHISRTNRITVS